MQYGWYKALVEGWHSEGSELALQTTKTFSVKGFIMSLTQQTGDD